MKEDYKKALAKLTILFLLILVPLIEQNCQKQKGTGTIDQLLFWLKNKKNSSISYVLTDQGWWCNVKRFLSYSKNYICKFMQVNSWHHKLFHSSLSFWIWTMWKEREKIAIYGISLEEKERWNKSFFIVLEGLSFGEKNKK